jgi:Gpi18-like mannosyltransferase
MQKPSMDNDLLTVLLSISIQIPLATLLGHFYDQTIFLQTGYLVNQGLNPYQPHLVTVFQISYLTGTSNVIGYPPPWTFLLGLIYRLTYNQLPNLFIYNFATKIPIIISNIALAFLTRRIMQQQNLPQKAIRFAWLFLLFNPFTLVTTTAWGEFDTVIALLCLIGVFLLGQGKPVHSALVLAFSFVLKPISLPLLGLPLLYCRFGNRVKIFWVTLVIGVVFGALWFAPFYLMNWAAPFSPSEVGSFFSMAGGMTLFNVIEVFSHNAVLPSDWWFMGYLWIPALLLGYFWLYRNPQKNFLSVTKTATMLLFIFFLSRSWLSEPNINLLLPLILILLGYGKIGRKTFHLFWIIPLSFLFLNYAFPQLFFLIDQNVISTLANFDLQFGTWRLLGRFGVTLLWYVLALKILFDLLSTKSSGVAPQERPPLK